ncbi:hypothetical protein AB1Y20_007502 [Prymnesium parvum]|uniref:Uncharacterized protein n=1 Tax=Prymnesium parvum TaxID=97485 RepID=A0AB34IV26_PRYPA|mmetsp:Transcript_45468/g.113034  ORF Transcript_45468/g.113034 Transcript_45468/m.113034 type:complete len:205 (-) Transcript_45468:150-764(-)|eukprot:CAMPEP_0182825616 /NCGR_PEP_ID=MMETSP0006_2-20121128/15931_1 /TAXON_ID=97485 /ORGANISM="Prymnesium parvum, Strain Texoma1" /LENGTH=204 /DNA_ID=CAMNT_0024952717 /DNA_START=205 /DNA_END=819 /DNA_ORIENTATION=-
MTDHPLAAHPQYARARNGRRAALQVSVGIRCGGGSADTTRGTRKLSRIGVLLLGAIGIVVVPMHKLVRARSSIIATLEGRMTFEEYRAMVGLLEHLRFIAQLESDATNVLYRPHGKGGEQKDGPATLIKPDELMRASLTQWATIIMSCAGALFTAALFTNEVGTLRASRAIVWATSDAAGDGKGSPSILNNPVTPSISRLFFHM